MAITLAFAMKSTPHPFMPNWFKFDHVKLQRKILGQHVGGLVDLILEDGLVCVRELVDALRQTEFVFECFRFVRESMRSIKVLLPCPSPNSRGFPLSPSFLLLQ